MRLAVIPARGGSKRIPRKNIKEFCGEPMIARSIKAALSCGIFDDIIVSTDDDEIAKAALSYGASVPFKRPKHLSDDITPTVPVIRHALQWYEDHHSKVDYVCCIYATAPFVSSTEILAAYEQLIRTGAKFCLPLATFAFPIQRAVTVIGNERIEMMYPENELKRSQDLIETYHDVGQFYWGSTEAWYNSNNLMSSETTSIQIPRWRAQDIDTEED
ncbi:pseudaminic acid cytidylyltransferase, partial [bacterium]|nr:pseudaminic acid cytidylyltransferase [bacterium]